MVRILSIAVFTVLALTGCRWNHTITGNNNIVSESRAVSGFSKIAVGGPFVVEITPGADYNVKIEADENLIDLVNLDKDGRTLKVRMRDGVSVRTQKGIRIFISAPDLESISCAGSATISTKGTLKSDGKVKLNVGGSGSIEANIDAPEVDGNIGGSGNIEVSGQTRSVSLAIGGSGDYRGEDLMAEEVKVTIGGSGSAFVYASSKLSARVAGSGTVRYKGSPSIDKSIAGSGEVSPL